MDIVSINGLCPPTTRGHEHRVANYQEKKRIKNNNPKLLENNQLCLYCNPQKELALRKTIYCDQYIHQVIIKLTENQKDALHQGFDKYGIPYELRVIIFNYSIIINTYDHFKTLNNNTLEHMLYCKECCPELLYIISDNICPHHIMCRNVRIGI